VSTGGTHVSMIEFMRECHAFIARRSLSEAANIFNTLLRNEQMARGAHILSLPLELRLYILDILYNSHPTAIYRHVALNRDILQKCGMKQVLVEGGVKKTKIIRIIEKCNLLIQMHFNDHLQENVINNNNSHYSLIVLLKTNDIAAYTQGTNRGRYIVAITDSRTVIQQLPEEIERLVVDSITTSMTLSAHNGALLAHHTVNPFHGKEEYISISLRHRLYKIWWIDNSNPYIVTTAH
jgi:hypothetical protein